VDIARIVAVVLLAESIKKLGVTPPGALPPAADPDTRVGTMPQPRRRLRDDAVDPAPCLRFGHDVEPLARRYALWSGLPAIWFDVGEDEARCAG
jgi:hypothetical protein